MATETRKPEKLSKELLIKLYQRLTMSIPEFVSELTALGAKVDHTKDGPVMHLDRGSPVLGVAHLDYVKFWKKPHLDVVKKRIHCPQLDDRLGVWVIMDLLPSFGIHTDILLTDSEECGRSTAKDFKTDKKFNWMYQFDRRGADTVLYQYDSKENRERLEASGLPCTWGSFSDICSLEHLGCSGWNVGTGYYNEHSDKCYADLKTTWDNAKAFAAFVKEHQGTHIPVPEQKSRGYRYMGGSWNSWDSDWQDDNYSIPVKYSNEPAWVCSNCRAECPGEHRYCRACWTGSRDISFRPVRSLAVTEQAPAEAFEPWCCYFCFDLNGYDREYCKGCGASFDDSYEYEMQDRASDSRGKDLDDSVESLD